MSFGFSVSDFITLARMTIRVYNEFREAPKTCDAFRTELLIFHSILIRTADLTRESSAQLSVGDKAALTQWIRSCKELIYVRIYGAVGVGEDCNEVDENALEDAALRTTKECRLFLGWRQKWGEKKFAARIPVLQQAVHSHVVALTAINSNIIRSQRDAALDIEAAVDPYFADLKGSQARLEAASQRVEETQTRMERQLQDILASKSRHQDSLMAQSLDASSPEGRETWMTLGRLLRAEGITPAMIKQNRDVLVTAMKRTLQEDIPESIPESYDTALESLPQSMTHPCPRRDTTNQAKACDSLGEASIDLLGSAPQLGATFSQQFLERQKQLEHPLLHSENVEDGISSLLAGMGEEDIQGRAEGRSEDKSGSREPELLIEKRYPCGTSITRHAVDQWTGFINDYCVCGGSACSRINGGALFTKFELCKKVSGSGVEKNCIVFHYE